MDTRAGHYKRQFQPKAGEDAQAALAAFRDGDHRARGAWVSASTVSELNQKVAGQIEAWCNQSIQGYQRPRKTDPLAPV